MRDILFHTISYNMKIFITACILIYILYCIYYDMYCYILWYNLVYYDMYCYILWYNLLYYDMYCYILWYNLVYYDMYCYILWYNLVYHDMYCYILWYNLVYHGAQSYYSFIFQIASSCALCRHRWVWSHSEERKGNGQEIGRSVRDWHIQVRHVTISSFVLK